ncbi:MAG: SIR2 family protein, partial [Colwellia sp.]
MSEVHPGYRIFVLGAGFSVPAGLPMASALFKEIRKLIRDNEGADNRFQRSLDEYIEYREKCDGVTLNEDDVDLEEFMSFLDIEHFLRLDGSDTLSEHGNAAQLFVKRYIGQIIHERTPAADALPQEYYDFAENLSVNDIVITLNYDVILERALDHIGKPYRLFANRFKSIGKYSNTVDNSSDEVVILKLHGSLDWFSNKSYVNSVDAFRAQGSNENPQDSIFNNNNRYGHYPLVDGPRSKGDPLLHYFRLKNIDGFYAKRSQDNVPMILSPSYMKIVYANPLLDFWHGLGQAGWLNLGVNI